MRWNLLLFSHGPCAKDDTQNRNVFHIFMKMIWTSLQKMNKLFATYRLSTYKYQVIYSPISGLCHLDRL